MRAVVRGMFEMFTDRARRVIVLAQEEARMLNHNYIGTEHLLLGLGHEGDGVAANALESLGIRQEAVRQQVEQIIGRGQQAPPGHIPFTPRAKKVLELARRESDHRDDGFIDTEHLLLALIREGGGVACQALVQLGADLERIRQQVVLLLPERAERSAVRLASRMGKRARSSAINDILARMGAVEHRLAGIERWVGMTPGTDDLDREIAHVRRQKESAIDSQDFESAAGLRDKEKELLAGKASRKKEWATAADRPSLAEELARVNAELEKLRAILRQHGIEPKDGAA
jgi:Clp amino terminal domain, pathogenicity island component/UvrB/uvrC motif